MNKTNFLISFPVCRFCFAIIAPLALVTLALIGCSGAPSLPKGLPQGDASYPKTPNDIYKNGSVLDNYGEGNEGLSIFSGIRGGKKNTANLGVGGAIGVNALLWQAAVDTVSFLPLAQVKPEVGIIITDWYTAPSSPNERIKLNVYVLSAELRADGVRVQVFKETRPNPSSPWLAVTAAPEVGKQLQDTIITRARQLTLSEP